MLRPAMFNSHNTDNANTKTWINFNFENCVSVAHEGVPGSPNRYRVRLRMDLAYKLTDLKCNWSDGAKRILKLSASTHIGGKPTVKVTKSFEIMVDPGCQVIGNLTPTVTRHKENDECWIEFPVNLLPSDLPMATS